MKLKDATKIFIGGNPVMKIYRGDSLVYSSEEITDPNVFTGTYYVSNDGNDSNDGYTPETAFATIAKVNTLTLNPGEEVRFRGGDTWTEQLTLGQQHSGSIIESTVISTYGTGRANINASADNMGIYVYNCDCIDISNFNITGVGIANSTKTGLKIFMDNNRVTNQRNISIDNVDVTGFRGKGIGLHTWVYPTEWTILGGTQATTRTLDGFTVTNCKLYGNGHSGIYSESDYPTPNFTNLYVADCEFYNNPGTNGDGSGAGSGSGLMMSGFDGGTIERCVAYNNGAQSRGNIGIWIWCMTNVTIQYCISYNNKTGNALDGGGFDIDGEAWNCVIQYCYSYNNEGSGFAYFQYDWAERELRDNVIRYNISVNDGRKGGYGGLHAWRGSNAANCSNNLFHNNTVYNVNTGIINNTPPCFATTGGDTGIILKNNILLANGTGVTISAGTSNDLVLKSDNIYHAINGAGDVGMTGGIRVNPELVNPQTGIIPTINNMITQLEGFKIGQTSPAKHIGEFIAGSTLEDFFGNTINPDSVDIGVHQLTTEPAPLPDYYPNGLFMFQDADTVVLNASNQMMQWTDKTGNGNHFIDAFTSGTKPTLVTNGINGLPSLTSPSGFISTDYYTNNKVANQYTLFTVVRFSQLYSFAFYIELGDINGFGLYSDGSNRLMVRRNSTLISGTGVNALAINTNYVIALVVNPNGSVSGYINGQNVFGGTTTLGTTGNNYMTQQLGNTSSLMSRIEMYDTALSVSDINAVNTRLMNRYGINQ